MAAGLTRSVKGWRSASRRWWWLPIPAALGAVGLASWWFTEPLDDPASVLATAPRAPARPAPPAEPEAPATWPTAALEGRQAKAVLLRVLEQVQAKLDRAGSYTALFHRQERLKGKLGPLQTMEMKARNAPFAIYFKFLSPQAGKEVVYAEGRHENKLIAHGGGFSRLLVPRLAVAPDHPLALADSRHPVTEAGLVNLAARLVNFRKLDLDDPDAVTVLDRDAGPDGASWPRSVHSHPHRKPERPFARVEVRYDPETLIPIDVRNFDWPAEGESAGKELLLAEHYSYERLVLGAPLTALDFDPANPAYSFHRY